MVFLTSTASKFLVLLGVVAGLAIGWTETAFAKDDRALKIEAAYLYNFLNYITWPGYDKPEEKKQASICVYGHRALIPYLEYVKARKQSERQLTIKPVHNEGSLDGCDMVIIGRVATTQPVLHTIRQKAILTVGLPDDFLHQNGMIKLTHQGERIAMAINKTRLQQAGLHVSSRLLALATEVK